MGRTKQRSPYVGQDLPPETVVTPRTGGFYWAILPQGGRWASDRWHAPTYRLSQEGPEGPWGPETRIGVVDPTVYQIVDLGDPWS